MHAPHLCAAHPASSGSQGEVEDVERSQITGVRLPAEHGISEQFARASPAAVPFLRAAL